MIERRQALSVGNGPLSTGFDERPHRFDMPLLAVAQNYRLDQGRPSEIVDMIERRAGFDQGADDFEMSEMGGGDQRGADIAWRTISASSATAAIVMIS